MTYFGLFVKAYGGGKWVRLPRYVSPHKSELRLIGIILAQPKGMQFKVEKI
jgi:hypothetical protein